MPRRLTRGWARAVVTVLALALVVTVTTGLWHEESESTGGPITPIRQTDPDAPHALWIGDSYTVGLGTDGPAKGYPCLVSDAFGWTCQLDAQSGTGFVNSGHRANEAYAAVGERLGRTGEAFEPDLVVVDAGRNDWRAAPATLRRAAVAYLDRTRATFPDAELVVMLPFLAGDNGVDYTQIDRIVRTAARGVQATVVDTTSPGWKRMVRSLATVDAIHPDAASHQVIADRLVDDFRRLGVPGRL